MINYCIMSSAFFIILPYLLIILGVLILCFFNIGIVAGIFMLIGIAMISEKIWPEKWN